MTRLSLVTDRSQVPQDADEAFLWDGSPKDSFKSQLGPSLISLGPVPPLNADFVKIALGVYASDHTVRRKGGGSEWNSRQFELVVPVSDPAAWVSVSHKLSETLNYLTGDRWTFEFVQLAEQSKPTSLILNHSKRVVLVSGGADSASGAIYSAASLKPGETHTFVSHASSGSARTPQRLVREQLDGLFPGKQAAHHRIFLGRERKRLDGSFFPTEPSNRSRSFLFLALGLAVAAQSKAPLWIPENGFASLNPPLGPERLGALSTRTTQPWFLWKVTDLLTSVGAHGLIENPFQLMTKGEMFKQVGEVLGTEQASRYLSSTNSCSHTDQNYQGGVASGTHCGVCFGCIVRRASFGAANIPDLTRYLSNEEKYANYIAKHSIINAATDFANSHISDATVMMMPLPPNLSASDAMDLCIRGQQEVRGFLA